MKIIVVGATGTIGRAIVEELSTRHEVISASRKGELTVDITDPGSIRAMYQMVGMVDAVVSATGSAAYKPLLELTDADYQLSMNSKMMGQVNLIRFGLESVREGGSFTLTTGILAQQPIPGSAAITLVNAGLEGFVKAAALEMPRGIRINAVSPDWVSETLTMMGRNPKDGIPAPEVARAYAAIVESNQNGTVLMALKH